MDANEIVAETQAHLADRVSELVAEGVDVAEAERAAVAQFGSARKFSRRVAQSAFETRYSTAIARCGVIALIGLFVSAFGASFTIQAPPLPSQFWSVPIHHESVGEALICLTFAGMSFFGVCFVLYSYLSRTRRSLALLIGGCVAALALAATIVNSRDISSIQNDIQVSERRITLLREGLSQPTPSPAGLSGPGPGFFRIPPAANHAALWSDPNLVFFDYVSSRSVAKAAWSADGQRWLSVEMSRHRALQARLNRYPRWFKWRDAATLKEFKAIWLWMAPFTTSMIAADWVAAWAGRRVFLARRRRRKRQAA